MRGKVYLFAPFALALLSLLSLTTIDSINQTIQNESSNSTNLTYPTASIAPEFLNLTDFNFTLSNLSNFTDSGLLELNADFPDANATNQTSENQTQPGDPISPNETISNQTGANDSIVNQTILNETDANETISNSTFLNQTGMNESITNQTIANDTIANQTLMDETILNGTISNNTFLNESFFNQTGLNQTSLNETDLNETGRIAELPELGILKEKFKHLKKLKFTSLKKRVKNVNGTNETVYDLGLSIASDKRKKSNSGEFDGSSIEILGLRDPTSLDHINGEPPSKFANIFQSERANIIGYFTTDFIGLNSLEFEEALISLPANSKTERIVSCTNYDAASNLCAKWEMIDAAFAETDGRINFKVDHFSGYAGVNITILNLQSFPAVGGNWTVRFTTTGSAPLTVTAIDNTTFDHDLEFKFIKCGEADAGASFNGTSAFIADYSCELEGSEESAVRTSGPHRLEFRFGDAVAYANNTASQIRWFLSNSTSDVATLNKSLQVTTPNNDPWTHVSNATTLTCFNETWFTPQFNQSAGLEKELVNGTIYIYLGFKGNEGVTGQSSNFTVSLLKYNSTGSVYEINRTNTTIDCYKAFIGAFATMTMGPGENATLYPGERLGFRTCTIQKNCANIALFWNRTDTYMEFSNETVDWCGNVSSNFNLSTGILDARGSCLTLQANDVTIDCKGKQIMGSGSGAAIDLNGFDNVVVKNCVISNFTDGIYGRSSDNFTLEYSTFYNNSDGVDIGSSYFALINSSVFDHNQRTGAGVNMLAAHNVTIINSSFINLSSGIVGGNSDNTYLSVINSTFINSTRGVFFYGLGHSNFSNNSFSGNDDAITFRSWSLVGTLTRSNKLFSNTFQNNSIGIKLFITSLYYIQNNSFINNTFRNSSTTSLYLLGYSSYPELIADNNFTNNIFYNASIGSDINISDVNFSTNIFLNNSFTRSRLGFTSGNMTLQNYVRVNVTSSNGVSLGSAFVNITNSSFGAINYTDQITGANGLTAYVPLNEFIGSYSVNTNYSYYNVTATWNGYTNSTLSMINYSQAVPIIIPVTVCGNLGYSATLAVPLFANGTCFTVTSSNIVLDCAGHAISGDGTGNGVDITSYSNVTIRNCNISSFDRGIDSEGNNLTIANNSIWNSTYGVLLQNNAFSNVTNNSIYNNSNGLGLFSFVGNNVNNTIANNIFDNNSDGIEFFTAVGGRAQNNTIANNTVRNSSSKGFHLNGPAGNPEYTMFNNFTNNIIISSPTGSDITFASSWNNYFINNSFNRSNMLYASGINNFTIQDYFRVYVTGSNLAGIESANANITNTSSGASNHRNLPTDANGYTAWVAVTEFFGNNSINTSFANYNFTANYSGVTNWTTYPTNQSAEVLVVLPIITCGSIATSTALTVSLNAQGTCFTANADNIAIDCNNYFVTGNGSGIGVDVGSRTNVTVKNCRITNFTNGVQGIDANNFTMLGSNVSNSTNGIMLRNGQFHNISASFFYNNTVGVNLSSTSGGYLNFSRIYNNTFNNNSYYALQISCLSGSNGCNNNTIENNTFRNSTISNLFLTTTSVSNGNLTKYNNFIGNLFYFSPRGFDINITNINQSTNILLNNSFNRSRIGFSNGNVTIRDYVRIYVRSTAGTAIVNANVNMTNSSFGATNFTNMLTDANGLTDWQEANEFIGNSSSNTSYGIYNFTVAYSGAVNSTLLPINDSKTILMVLPVVPCGTIAASTTLPGSIASNGTCYTISASNINFNCNNFNITGTQQNGSGIVVNGVTGVNITNCHLVNFSNGIELLPGSHIANLSNNTLTNNSNAGIYVNGSANTLLIRGNKFISNGNYSILVDWSGNSNITSNNVSSQFGGNYSSFGLNATAFYFLNLTNSSITNNAISTVIGGRGPVGTDSSRPGKNGGGAIGIFLVNGTNNTFSGNRIVNISGGNGGAPFQTTAASNTGGAGGKAFAIILDSSRNNTFSNNSVTGIFGGKGSAANDIPAGNGAAGGAGGSAIGIALNSSDSIWFNSFNISKVIAGSGGDGAKGGAVNLYGIGGDAGNSTLFISNSSLNTTILDSNFSNSSAGVGGNGSTLGGRGSAFGLQLLSTNFTLVNSSYFDGIVNNSNGTGGLVIGLHFLGSSNNNAFNSVFNYLPASGNNYSVYSEANSQNNLLQNLSITNRKYGWGSGNNNLTVRWNVDIFVGFEDNSPANGANITIRNSTSGVPQYTGLTGATGYNTTQAVTEFTGNDTANTTYNSYNLTATLSPYLPVSQLFDISSYRLLTLTLSPCGTITTDLSLSADVSTTRGTCYTIGADNIQLDCNGYKISGNASADSYGIASNGFRDFRANNCRILNFTNGIFLNNTVNATFNGVNLTNSTQYNLFLNNATYTNFTNSSFGNISLAYGDIYMNNSATGSHFINTAFNRSTTKNGTAGNNMTVFWFMGVIVRDQSNNPVQSASVNIANVTGASMGSGTSDANGRIANQVLQEYDQVAEAAYVPGCTGSDDGINCYIPYNVSATKTVGLLSYRASNSSVLNTSSSVILYLNALPSISLNSPNDLQASSSKTVTFSYAPVDDGGYNNCSIWTNATGTFEYTQLNQSAILNNSANTISYTFAADGDYLWNVQCYDNAIPSSSNFSAANRTVRVDSTGPSSIQTIGPTLGNSSNTSRNWVYANYTFTELNAFNCWVQWVNTSTYNLTATLSNSNCFLNITGQTDGNWNYTLFVNDSAGNLGYNGTFTVTVDTLPPSSIKTESPTLSNNSHWGYGWVYVNASFNEPNPGACTLQYYNGSIANYSMARLDGTCNVNLTSQPDGVWNYTIIVNDSAGNIAQNGTFTVTVDTLAPSNIAMVSPTLANLSFTYRNWVYVNATFTELFPNACVLQWNNGSLMNLTMTRSNNNCYLNVTDQPDGYWNYTIIVNDTSANSAQNGTFYISMDGNPPANINTIYPTPANNSFLNYSWVYINYTFTEINPYNCWVQWANTSVYNITAGMTGNNCYLNITGHADGIWNYTVFANDSSGNIGGNGTFNLTIDTTFPMVDYILPTPDDEINLSRNWIYVNTSYTDANLHTALLYWNSIAEPLTCNAHACFLNKTSLAEGAYSYYVFLNDSAGNSNQTSARSAFIDTINPSEITAVFPTPENYSRIHYDWVYVNATFTEMNPNNCILYWLNGSSQNLTMARSGNNCYLNVTGQPLGIHNYTIIVNDTTGNLGENGTLQVQLWENTALNYKPRAQFYNRFGNANITAIFASLDLSNLTIDSAEADFNYGNGTNITINSNNISLNFSDSPADTEFFNSGIFERGFDSGNAQTHWKVGWDSVVVENSTLLIEAAISQDNVTYSTFENLTNSAGSVLNGTPARYMKYRITFGSNGSVTAFLNEINATALYGLNSNITVNLTNLNSAYSLAKSCSTIDGNCTVGFIFASELIGGNYSVNITATNNSAFYEPASVLYETSFEEAITRGSLLASAKTVSPPTWFLINVTLTNRNNATMFEPLISYLSKGQMASIDKLSTTCGASVPTYSHCNATFNVTVPNLPVSSYTVTWNASYRNNNQTNMTISNSSSVIVQSTHTLSASVSLINITGNLSQMNTTLVTITNTGNTNLANITISFVPSTMDGAWITFDPYDFGGLFPNMNFDLDVMIQALAPFTPGVYTGKVNITADDLINGPNTTATSIDIMVISEPQVTATPTVLIADQNLTSNPTLAANISNPGNAPVTNVSVTLENSTIPDGWISFDSIDPAWDSLTNSWTSITEGTEAVLQIIVTILDFIEGVFSAIIKIVSDEGVATYVNVTVNVTPRLDAVSTINLTIQHGFANATEFYINSTGNVKLVNLMISYNETTLPGSWLAFNTTFIENITEFVNYSVQFNVTVPFGTPPGNYSGQINISGYNANRTIGISVEVPENATWYFLPFGDQYKEFGLAESGAIGTITINNTGNANLSFDIGYGDFGGRASCIGGDPYFQDLCTQAVVPSNPTLLNATKNTTTSFTISKVAAGFSNNSDGYALQITMANNSGVPTSNSTVLYFNITNAFPQFRLAATYVNTAQRPYVEYNQTVTLNVTATDDESYGLNPSTAIFNISRPDGTNETYNALNLTLNPFTACGGTCQDAQSYNLAYNATNMSGRFNVTFQVQDALSQQNMTSFYFTVITITNLTLSGNGSNITNAQRNINSTLLLNLSANNTGLVSAYSINLSGMFARQAGAADTLSNWSFNAIPTIPYINGTLQNLTTFNITVGQRSLGIYYFTPNATWAQPNGTIEVIWGPNLTINITSNPDFNVTASNQSLAIPHGFNQTEWFSITPVGNDNITNYTISLSTNYANFSVTFNHTSGNLTLDGLANVSMNISVVYGANSGFRNFTVNVTGGNYSKSFVVNLTVPFNNTWAANTNLFTLDGIAGENSLDNRTLIAHYGTGDAFLNFTFNLTGNMTDFSNLVNTSKYLNTTQSYDIGINYTAPDNNYLYVGCLNITEKNSSSYQLVNITFRSFTVELSVVNITAPLQVIAGDIINESVLLIFGGQNTTSNTTWSMFLNSTQCPLLSNTTFDNESRLACTAPALLDAVYYDLTVRANYSTGSSYLVKNTTNSGYIFYKDITPPQIIAEYSNDTERYENITLSINATDNLALANATVQVTFPNLTAANYTLLYNPGTNLFANQFNLTALGYYSLVYFVNDTTGNMNYSSAGSFEIYETRIFSGTISNLEGNPIVVNFTVRNTSESNYEAFSTNSSGTYNKSLRAKWYELNLKFLFYNVTADRVDFNTINQSLLSLDNFSGSDISSQILGAKAGFAVISNMPTNGTLIIEYADLLATITDETLLRIYNCHNYTYASRSCVESWSQMQNTSLNTIGNTINGTISAFANTTVAYALVQYTVPTPTPTTLPPYNPPSGGSVGSTGGYTPPQPPAASPTPIPAPTDNVSKQIEELKKLLQENKTKDMGLEPGVQSIVFELYPGESSQTSVHIKNTLNATSKINVTLVGVIRDFITASSKQISLNRMHETDLMIFATIPDKAKTGNYYGELQLQNEVGKISIPVTVRVLDRKEERSLDLRLQPLVDTIDPGETLRVEVNIYNLAEASEIKGIFHLEAVDPVTDSVLEQTQEEEITLQNTYNSIKPIKIPSDAHTGRLVIRGVFDYSVGETLKKRDVTAIAYVRVQTSFWSNKLFGMISIWQFIPLLLILLATIFTYYRQYSVTKSKRRYVAKVDFTKLPEPGLRAGFLGLIAETKVRSFAAIDKLQMHTLIAGATGSGKTVAAQVIVEEALQKNTAVLVFDPTAQWTGFLRAQKNRDMLLNYRRFGMNTDEAKAFKGNIYVVRDPNMAIDIKKLMKPGEITVFVMNKLSFADHETFISNTVKQVFAAGLPESPQLKLLCVYDEVHRLLPKFGGRGEGFIQIERGAREYRKWGVGMLLISQVLSDFVGEIKANIGTEIQMRTKYEGDLERLKLKYGEDSARSIVKESIGSGMVQNSEYNNGQPYFVSFRPLLHNVVRLSDTELSQYETYNDKVEKLEADMEQLRQEGHDVLDLELEINLARDKVKKGAFNIVEIYLDSLSQKIESMRKKSGQKPSPRIDMLDFGIGDILGEKKADEAAGKDAKTDAEKKDIA
ncbi:MAG: right-handed parallel beta-helix repeat-containing protein [Candidatus Micrarchaeota archaeon]